MQPDITLIFPNSPFLINPGVFPPLGILYLSAFLKQQGHRVQCLDFGIGHTREDAKARVIGISFTTPQRESAFELCRYYKSRGKMVVAGGPHPTHMRKECLEAGFDVVIGGYGEAGLANLLAPMTQGLLPSGGVHSIKQPKIDEIPYPDRDALPLHLYDYKIDGVKATPIMTSRGCYSNCSFCGRISKEFYMQSAKRTFLEMGDVWVKYGYEAFMIYDDVFIAKKRRLEQIVEVVEGDNFKFRCFARAELLTEAVCRLLKRMGMVEVGVGVESGSETVLRRNFKGTTPDLNTQAVKNLQSAGIRAKTFLIIGLPGETHGTVLSTVQWVKKTKPDDIDVTVFQPLPGSPVFAEPERWGVQFEYNGKPGWYKGKPGEYVSSSRTEGLSAEEIVRYRDEMEGCFKKEELLC